MFGTMGTAWCLALTSVARLGCSRERPAKSRAEISSDALAVKRPKLLLVTMVVIVGLAFTPAPRAQAVPAPEVEYVYDVVVRRHYGFPNNDALSYGRGICDKVSQGESYEQVMGYVKSDVTPSDEFAANYLVSYAVSVLCPDLIWQLRNSAGGYRPPVGTAMPGTYY
jgi:hypothetical protein